MKKEKPWPQDCCSSGHHLFDRPSAISDRRACRCGKLQGFWARNVPASQCVPCALRNKAPKHGVTFVSPKDRCYDCAHMRTFHSKKLRLCSVCNRRRPSRDRSNPKHDFVEYPD